MIKSVVWRSEAVSITVFYIPIFSFIHFFLNVKLEFSFKYSERVLYLMPTQGVAKGISVAPSDLPGGGDPSKMAYTATRTKAADDNEGA